MARAATGPDTDGDAPPAAREPAFHWPLLPALTAYFLYGVGHITYMTFIIAFLRNHGTSMGEVSWLWAALGLFSLVSAFAWGHRLDQLRGGRALAAVLLLVAIGAAAPLVSTSGVGLLASATLFGAGFLNVVSTVTLIVKRALHPGAWAAGIALDHHAGQGRGKNHPWMNAPRPRQHLHRRRVGHVL